MVTGPFNFFLERLEMKLLVCLMSTLVLMFAPADGRKVNKDKTGTRSRVQIKESPQTPKNMVFASLAHFKAEKTGFEPADRFDPIT